MRDDDLRRMLRSAARAHRPDRARILARVERGTAGERRRRSRGRLYRAGTAVSAVGVFVLGGWAAVSAAGEGKPGPRTGPACPAPLLGPGAMPPAGWAGC